MDSKKPIYTAAEILASTLANAPDVSDASVRVLKLLTNVFQQLSKEKYSESFDSLTDAEFLQKLAISASVVSALDTRESIK